MTIRKRVEFARPIIIGFILGFTAISCARLTTTGQAVATELAGFTSISVNYIISSSAF